MKKWFVFLIVVLSIGFISACGDSEASTNESNGEGKPEKIVLVLITSIYSKKSIFSSIHVK